MAHYPILQNLAIVNQNIDILFLFHFFFMDILSFNSSLSLSHRSLSSPLFFFFSFFFSSNSLIQSLPLSRPSLCESMPMHWCISEHTTWVKWCGVVGLVTWQVVWRHGQVVAMVWPGCCNNVGLVASTDLFPFFFFFFLSLFSLETSLHGSHSLVELMV